MSIARLPVPDAANKAHYGAPRARDPEIRWSNLHAEMIQPTGAAASSWNW